MNAGPLPARRAAPRQTSLDEFFVQPRILPSYIDSDDSLKVIQ